MNSDFPGIIFIGPPGSGKSSIGRALAKKIEQKFADTDALIEESQGKSVSQIFIEEGEIFFRQVEEAICLARISENISVLSLGGGAILSLLVREQLLSSNNLIIFLDVTLAVAAPRVGFNRDRPLLLHSPRQQWQQLMDIRRPIYEELASLVIEVGDRPISEIVDEILSKGGSL